MQIPEIISNMQKLLDTARKDSVHYLGKERAYASALLYELELLRKSELAVITDEYSKDLAYNKAEGKARASKEYRSFLAKQTKAKLSDELTTNDHKQAENMMKFLERSLSLEQSAMKLR